MFGTGSNRTNDGQNTSPVSSLPADQAGAPAPIIPNTTVTPTAPTLKDSAAPYLETDKSSTSSTPMVGSDSFLADSPGTPPIVDSSAGTAPPLVPGSEGLVKIKQQALQSLAPLVDHLEQTPEERFKTLMMMIQASDNSEYLDEAYAAASDIKDEKERAQALLDVINEINYFTQHQAPNKSA